MNKPYDWKVINERVVAALHPSSSVVAMKFIKTQEELDAFPNLKYWKQESTVCTVVGIAAYWNITIAMEAEYMSIHCRGNNGMWEREQEWYDGVALNEYFKWHGRKEDSLAHTQATLADVPEEGHIAVVVSPIYTNDIPDPDAIIISVEPGAAFHLFAGLIEKDYHEINFIFRGESTCVETWCSTYTKGRPGLSLGCRGDRCNGALQGHEVRLSISTPDLLKALEGIDRLKSDGIFYPYYPAGVVEVDKL